MKSIFALIVVTIIICLLINNNATKKMKAEYSLGEKNGFEMGYSEAEEIFKTKIDEQRDDYKKRIENQKNDYEKKINISYQKGFDEGRKQKQKEIEDKLQKMSAEKQKNAQWNDVLFNVNN